VEKILAGDEQLPPTWPVHGTTGYEFAALVDALLVDPDEEPPWIAATGTSPARSGRSPRRSVQPSGW
jgi:(1->4)-alpha-D-glucan 1-alpha-D-glucosylmutase